MVAAGSGYADQATMRELSACFALATAYFGPNYFATRSQLALASNYADQSHLHRNVMAFAGMTPATVAVSPFLAVGDVAWPPSTHLACDVSERYG